ncbi:GNAT family N-acetyltransferase [Flavobacteriales bacterium]|nr:GNAT family N-acetyltransferase [Flavobacteriales bacterium]
MDLRKVNINKELDSWNDIINNSPDFYTIAHNPSLIGFIENTFGWKGDSFFIMNRKEIIGIYQHSYPTENKSVSLPHFSYGGIIRKDEKFNKKEIFENIKSSLPESFEIRGFKSYGIYFTEDKVATYLELKPTIEEQLAVFKSNHRRKIKKAYKNNLKITISDNVESMALFYSVYCRNMLRLGSPPLSNKFFNNLLKEYKFGEVKVFLVESDGEVIGGAVTLSYNNFVEDCWLSTLSTYNHLYTNLLLYWEMIKYSIEKEKKYFSFGRSTRNSSLLHFKRQWTPIEKQLYFSYSEKKNGGLKKMTFLTKIWRLLPLKIANFIGPKIAEKLY